MPADYAIPWVTITETPEGNELRVKMKQTLSTIQMVKVPGGSVEMPGTGPDGQIDPSSKQIVQIKPFWMGKTELPWEVYDTWRLEHDLSDQERLLRAGEENLHENRRTWSRPSSPYGNADYGFGHDGYAAISIHPQSAAAFCRWMSIVTGRKYRLPTEAEWEHACSAGTALPTTKADLAKVAWFADNSENMSTAELVAQPVGTKPANAFGLHDMLGNVGEWVVGLDGKHVLKGGGFESLHRDLTPSFRLVMDPNVFQIQDPQGLKSVWWLSDGKYAGFRIVREEE